MERRVSPWVSTGDGAGCVSLVIGCTEAFGTTKEGKFST